MNPETRAGHYVRQSAGHRAFIPSGLPPDPPIEYDADLVLALSEADDAVGRLDGVSDTVPNPDLFVAMYVRKEAVLSSQIEGTQSSLEDVLEYEAGAHTDDLPRDVDEVYNHVRALNHGLARLPELPLSLRLLREIHAVLMENVRGGEKEPGEFRRSQNWIGPAGTPLRDAVFVPPPPHEMKQSLGDLERYLHSGKPDLVAAGVAHCQFETIHPFLDGNGRLGRLLIALMLCERERLRRPLLYLSHYLRRHRQRYYDMLTAVREDGDWESWLKFFLTGVAEVAREGTETARRITRLQERDRRIVADEIRGTYRFPFLDLLFRYPSVTARFVESRLNVAYGTANNLIHRFEGAGILEEVTGQQRYRRYRYRDYMDLFTGKEEAPSETAEPLTTEASDR
ncbi:MAG TPA: Fic family protein [Gemmatimonadota bacterium]|nr:Fic family protein [Gemmatimonadota bacterium]